MSIKKLEALYHDQMHLRLEMVRLMESLFPNGSFIEITDNRGTFHGTVVRHGCWWSDPLSLTICLDSTGNDKNFYLSIDDIKNIK